MSQYRSQYRPQPRPPHARLDPRDPLVLDTRELGRRAGSMLRVQRTVPAPEGLALELVGIAAGSELRLDLKLEAVMEGVLVSGTVNGTAVGECGRCLEPVRLPVEAELLELYAYPGDRSGEDAEDIGQLDGDFIELAPRLRDAVLLALPLRPVCSEDCAGLCATCGARLDEVSPGHTHDDNDPRWSALHGLADRLAGTGPGEAAPANEEKR